jgi:hypothetical protein
VEVDELKACIASHYRCVCVRVSRGNAYVALSWRICASHSGLSHARSMLMNVFEYFGCLGVGDDFTMQSLEFSEFLQTCRIPDNRSRHWCVRDRRGPSRACVCVYVCVCVCACVCV